MAQKKTVKKSLDVSPKTKILDAFIEILKERMSPSLSEMADKGVTRDMIRHHYVNLLRLRIAAKEARPEAFKNVIDETVFTPKNIKKVKAEAKKYKRYVVTTAVTGMPVHKAFYKNLKNYCKKNNAKLLILASSDPAALGGFEIDGALAKESIVLEDLELNSSIFISTFKTSAKQVNPLTGIKRIGQRERSMIVGSPKQFLEYVPIANDKMCHALMTTGAITVPKYKTERYMSQRTAYIAEFDHKMGAIVVEIEDSKFYHVRQIQAEYGTGFFVDNGTYYKLDKTEKLRAEAFTPGDIHVGSVPADVQKATDEMISHLKPKRVFLHDLFDGKSVNHHEAHSYLSKANRSYADLSLETELKMCADYMNDMKKKHSYVDEWVVVRSNHDEFIDRYLNSGEYVKDAINSKICHKLAMAKLEGKLPLEAGMLMMGMKADKVKFLRINNSYKVCGIEHGVHGHLGMNGQRNPANGSLEVGYGPGTYGHSHSPGILRDVFRVGTSTAMRIGYNNGASSWMNTHGVTYHNASRQLLNIINGKWRKK